MYYRLPELDPMAKRRYKVNLNGSGIQIWKCKLCPNELNDINTRNGKRKYCDNCSRERKKERDRLQALKRKSKA